MCRGDRGGGGGEASSGARSDESHEGSGGCGKVLRDAGVPPAGAAGALRGGTTAVDTRCTGEMRFFFCAVSKLFDNPFLAYNLDNKECSQAQENTYEVLYTHTRTHAALVRFCFLFFYFT